jgi:anhydro-N-acetylmuramic acid kinase
VSKLLGALGMMSGTSLDGIDVAYLETDGENTVRRFESETYPYRDRHLEILREALESGKDLTRRDQRTLFLADAEMAITTLHAEAARRFLARTGFKPEIVGFHGQTIIHRPDQGLTVQLGNGRTLARELGIPVAYDMRAADVAAGGQGAPLVPVYHRALAASVAARPVAFVNIGGVGNVTWISADDALLAFDTGPGNALIDDWMLKETGTARDGDGAAARNGRVDESIVAQFLGDSFFEQTGPKSLDRNSFAGITLDGLSTADGAATLTAVTARSIAMARQWFPADPKTWIICGGGRHNGAIMAALAGLLPDVRPAEAFGFDGDGMEAEAWAYLAVRCLKGLPISFPTTTRAPVAMAGGVIAGP